MPRKSLKLTGLLAELRQKFANLILDKYGEEPETPSAHILLLGECGHGKSAMINTMVKAILGYFYRVANFGAGRDATKTLDLKTLENFGIKKYMLKQVKRKSGVGLPYENEKFFQHLPRITDFAGLGNENQDGYKEILKLLILGYIPPGTSIEFILQRQQEFGTGNLKHVFRAADPKWKITRILFVQSCRTAISSSLAECVGDVVRQLKNNTQGLTYNGHVHLMITKYDQSNPNFLSELKSDLQPAEAEKSETKTTSQESKNVTDTQPAETDKEEITTTSAEAKDETESQSALVVEDMPSQILRIEDKLAHIFSFKGDKTHSITKWISCCDDVGYDNIEIDILAIKFLYELLKHPDPDTPREITVNSDEVRAAREADKGQRYSGKYNTCCKEDKRDGHLSIRVSKTWL